LRWRWASLASTRLETLGETILAHAEAARSTRGVA
jgi:hypothetical protein